MVVTSGAKDRVDIIFGVVENGTVHHKYWLGWLAVKRLGLARQRWGFGFLFGRHLDRLRTVFMLFRLVELMELVFCRYNFYDGTSWQPSGEEWYEKWYEKGKTVFTSNSSVVSWGENRLDILGVSGWRLAPSGLDGGFVVPW